MISSFRTCFAIFAIYAVADGQAEQTVAASFGVSLTARPNPLAPRSLLPGSAVCVNPPMNLTGLEIEAGDATRELARQIREAGFQLGSQGCAATVFTEIVTLGGRRWKNAELEFRIVFSDEQIPRLCSSAHGRSVARHDALI